MGSKVKLRQYQAALGARIEQLITAPDRAKEAYKNKIGSCLKLYDSAAIDRYFVENICEKEKPSFIIFDQIDKIRGFKADRPDLVFGEIYQWARELAKTYCPIIGVCQADGTAEGVMWLDMSHVTNAKTAKQAEADWILGIGRNPQNGFEYVRYLNISKNKLTGDPDTDPTMRHGKIEVLLKPDIARYEDF